MTLSIEVISFITKIFSSPQTKSERDYLDQHVEHFSETSLYAIAALVPLPPLQQVFVHRTFIDEHVLCQLPRIVVQKVAQGVYRLRDSSSEGRVLLWEIFR